MTETEAKQKLCPYRERQEHMPGNEKGCINNKCMAWERTCKPVDDKPGEGYCRKFGEPDAK